MLGKPKDRPLEATMHYGERLLSSGSVLTRFSHRRRLKTLLQILSPQTYALALDYGCADGWILGELQRKGVITRGVGVDIDPSMITGARKRWEGSGDHLRFVQVQEFSSWCHKDCYDLILCLETLEHLGNRRELIRLFFELLKPGGSLVASAPIEIGPSLIAKQFGRYLANLRGNYGYETYTYKELFFGLLGKTERIFSSHRLTELSYKGHKGFDYHWVEEELREFFSPLERSFSPFPWLRSWLNATVFFVGKKNLA